MISMLYMIAFLLLSFAILLILKITPTQAKNDFIALANRNRTLRYKIESATGKRKQGKIGRKLEAMVHSVEVTHAQKQFGTICTITFVALIIGIQILIITQQLLLIPIALIVGALVPFIYAQTVLSAYSKTVTDELEAALTTITASYVASEDIISAVRDSLEQAHINPPVSDVFKHFLSRTLINSNIKLAILMMKDEIDNSIFHEWCDTLAACQDNISLKYILQPCVDKYCNERIVNAELEADLAAERRSFYLMVFLVVVNYPLIYMLNAEWFELLVTTPAGQIVTGIVAVIVLFCVLKARKLTQPIKYKR